ncbi:1195_t:CDS:2, partial [Gigaspora margarita]
MDQEFPFNAGWALKKNMKLGKKAVNLKTENRYLPEDMHASLENLAINRELTFKKIPLVKTIKDWIGRYSTNFKKELLEKALLEN